MDDKDYLKINNGENDTYGNDGPRMARSDKGTKRYGKRVILFFILGVGLLLFIITVQAQNLKQGRDNTQKQQEKTYRVPQASGFAELAAGMRRDNRITQVVTPEKLSEKEPEPAPEKTPRRIAARRATPALPPLPCYYSNKNDAQAASTLRSMKLQALTAAPVAEGFKSENKEANVSRQNGAPYPNAAGGSPAVMGSEQMAALTRQAQQNDPNGQMMKQNFLRGNSGGGSFTAQGYSEHLPLPQQFPYELKAGTIIPGIMLTGINSDLPGNVIGQVSENVWDTSTGKYVLIPKGTKILGAYDSQVTFGQKRVLLVWNRLVFPNGATLNIAGSPGIDQAGYSGLSGRVNEHWGTMLKAALLASVFVAGAEIVYDKDSQGTNENKSPRDVAAESVAAAVLEMGSKIMNRASDVQPTITIRPGKRIGIFVQQDVVFPFPYF